MFKVDTCQLLVKINPFYACYPLIEDCLKTK